MTKSNFQGYVKDKTGVVTNTQDFEQYAIKRKQLLETKSLQSEVAEIKVMLQEILRLLRK